MSMAILEKVRIFSIAVKIRTFLGHFLRDHGDIRKSTNFFRRGKNPYFFVRMYVAQ